MKFPRWRKATCALLIFKVRGVSEGFAVALAEGDVSPPLERSAPISRKRGPLLARFDADAAYLSDASGQAG